MFFDLLKKWLGKKNYTITTKFYFDFHIFMQVLYVLELNFFFFVIRYGALNILHNMYIKVYKKNTTSEWTWGATEVLCSPVEISTF